MKALFSASSIDRIAICAPSAALPGINYASNRYADGGTVKHAFFEAARNIGPEAALAAVSAEWRDECALIDLSDETGLGRFMSNAQYLSEVAFAFDVKTGKARVLGQSMGRDYSAATADEVVGTVDLVGLTKDEVVVPDLKTGHRYLDPTQLRQLKFLSLAAARTYDRTRAVSGVILLREDGSSYFKRAEFDELELDLFEIELRAIVARVLEARAALERGERLTTVEGEHCRYCPAFDYCPSKMALVKSFAAAPESIGVTIEGATEEELVVAWERAVALEQVVERVKDSIRMRARERPLRLGKGQVLGPVKVEETVKVEVAAAVLTVLHGIDTAQAAVETKTAITKSSIDKALRKHVLKPGLKIGELNDTALDAVRAKNGFVVRVDVKKRKEKEGDFAPPALPSSEAKSTLQDMLAEGVRQNEEAMKASGGGA